MVFWCFSLLYGKGSFNKMNGFKNWLKQEKNGLKNDFYAYPKGKILWMILGIALLFLAIFRLWTVISFQRMAQWDIWLVNQVEQLRNSALDVFFLFLSNFASGYFIIVAFLILAFFLIKRKRKKAAFTVFLTLVGSGFFIWIFKNLFSRPRPFGCLSEQDCFSFPSGHTTIAFYFYGMLFNLITRFVKLRKRYVLVLAMIFGFLIFLVALSRIYLGYHFLTDIVGGFLLGGVFLLISALMVDFFYQ